MKKQTCTRCKAEKKQTDFHMRISGRTRQSWCRECMNGKKPRTPEYRAKLRDYVDRKRAVARHLVRKYKESCGCADCGISDWRVLDFDHVRGKKTRPVSTMLQAPHSLEAIFGEIEKCEVRCANCHRIKTREREDSLDI